MKLLREYIREFLKEERGLMGSCVNSFDGDGYCIQPGVAYADTSALAVGDERADEISEEEFRAAVTIPSDLDQRVAGHEVFYLLDREENQYMLYDSDDDIHYFFGK
tara:strand:- start:678 stop:995 length:318 start_codon:yes stop_codon:yes gene_type:complete